MNRVTLERAAEILRGGGIVIYATETFYGLGALARDAEALAKLTAAKLRPEGKQLPLIAADRGQVNELTRAWPPLAEKLAEAFWPGPLTLVFPAADGLAPEISADGTIAIRIPSLALARELAQQAGGAIVSTSANLSGEAPVCDPAKLSRELLSRVDAVLDGGITPGGLPSTVIAFEKDALRIVRAGAISIRDVAPFGGVI